MLCRSESACKWTLFGLLLASMFLPIVLMLNLKLSISAHVIETLIFFALFITSIQSILGLIGWFMLHRLNNRGKNVILRTYIGTLGALALLSVFQHITLVVPGILYFHPLEFYIVSCLLIFNVAVVLLQHFWTRDLF